MCRMSGVQRELNRLYRSRRFGVIGFKRGEGV